MEPHPDQRFTLYVLWSQVAVFRAGIDRPFNTWTKTQVRQGFAWRPGSVCFGTLEEGGELEIGVRVGAAYTPSAGAVRAIRVPFELPAGTPVEIATPVSGHIIAVAPGAYALVFESGYDGQRMWATFFFIEDDSCRPCVLRADDELDPPRELVMAAEPA